MVLRFQSSDDPGLILRDSKLLNLDRFEQIIPRCSSKICRDIKTTIKRSPGGQIRDEIKCRSRSKGRAGIDALWNGIVWWFKCDFYFEIMAEGIILFISKRHYTINLVRFRNHVLRIAPNARFLTTSLGTRFAALRSVSRSRDGPSSRVLSHVLGVLIHGQRL